jgi:hypothetical protein
MSHRCLSAYKGHKAHQNALMCIKIASTAQRSKPSKKEFTEVPAMSEKLPPLIITPPGLYKHYKGMLYEVIGTVRHSEDLSPMTLYRALYGEHGFWVRPAAMFNEEVVIDGVRQPRFTKQVEK